MTMRNFSPWIKIVKVVQGHKFYVAKLKLKSKSFLELLFLTQNNQKQQIKNLRGHFLSFYVSWQR